VTRVSGIDVVFDLHKYALLSYGKVPKAPLTIYNINGSRSVAGSNCGTPQLYFSKSASTVGM